jgi:DNA repair ATPase RecN
MAFPKKPMTENEKKAKLTALKDAHKQASDVMTQSLYGSKKDPKALKDHVKDMSDEAMHGFKNDSDNITDPKRLGKVIGRQVSYENASHSADDQSVYDPNDLNSIEERLKELMEMKKRK